ncbi:STAS domain-containing protein [Ramlibacter sp. H39-3-26]|uniref:STAS domain-containing protein n=1 Tax=Curvibacter soli TaxID=3031331 RepID=UPI0023DB16F9|nr:STAS domain-containing protein [Ramlibacter sp. H39-3-26]MDF1484689.1 STAS domain-containing protein [Ramlibacter sp. H39-3-26]
MSKDSTPGLLSKVVKFVRNPTVHWADLEQSDMEHDSNYSKQMLKEMIERKRRNDFVRRREFDHLRKLRRREALVGQGPAEGANQDPGRPSFFQSSMASRPDDRAGTLKKIDEIEAQMSMQWWKTKQGAPAVLPADGPPSIAPSSNIPLESAPGAPLTAPLSDLGAYATTLPASVSPTLDARALAPLLAPLEPDFTPPPAAAAPVPAAEPVVVEAPSFVHDPELEEAAIRFANGDIAGAEASLLEVLAAQPAPGSEEVWMTLFDLYRATGQHERFEGKAIEFAQHFGRSAPLWFSLPEMLGDPALLAAANGAPAAPGVARAFTWRAPSAVSISTVAALQAALARAVPPWTLTWSALTAIEPPAVAPLASLAASWAEQPVQLRFIGTDALLGQLEAHTPSGDATVSQDWWRLRLEILRLLGRADDFDLVALDYCVTYEVSPPSWQPVRCECVALVEGVEGQMAEQSLVAGGPESVPGSDAPLSSLFDTQEPPALELSGLVLGDASETLARFDGQAQQRRVLVVACDGLARVDFSAAGSVLNWVAARQAEGARVHFRNMHRLVAIFFNVLGINEHALVIPRRN